MTEDNSEYKLVGEHIHDGRHFSGVFPAHILDKIKDLEFDDSDVIITTYPKSGTHWIEAVTWMLWTDSQTDTLTGMIGTGKMNNLPFIEMNNPFWKVCGFDTAAGQKPPRVIRSHLPADYFQKTLSTKKTKFIILMRNIKDLLVSFYHFYKFNKLYGPYTGTWDNFFQMFREKRLDSGDYFDYNLGWWNLRNNSNILIIQYEDMLSDPVKEVSRVAKFLDREASDEYLRMIAEATSFNNMKETASKNASANFNPGKIYRKGQLGNWKEHFTVAQNEEMDAIIKDKLEGSGLQFQYEYKG